MGPGAPGGSLKHEDDRPQERKRNEKAGEKARRERAHAYAERPTAEWRASF